jgi:hypothetical protein
MGKGKNARTTVQHVRNKEAKDLTLQLKKGSFIALISFIAFSFYVCPLIPVAYQAACPEP